MEPSITSGAASAMHKSAVKCVSAYCSNKKARLGEQVQLAPANVALKAEGDAAALHR